jgi:hypothetical protein
MEWNERKNRASSYLHRSLASLITTSTGRYSSSCSKKVFVFVVGGAVDATGGPNIFDFEKVKKRC